MKKTTLLFTFLFISLLSYGQSTFINEDFNGNSLPSGWHTLNYGSLTDLNWTFGSGFMPTGDDFTSNAAIFNDGNNAGGNKVILYHDPVDLSQHKAIMLSFDYAIQAYNTDGQLMVVVERKPSLGGWLTFQTYDTDTNPTPASYDFEAFLSAHASDIDLTQVKIGFMWDDEGASSTWGAGIDNVLLEGTPKNDDCASAYEITSFPYTHSQDMTGTTNNNGFITAQVTGSGMNDGVWYKFTAPYNGKMLLEETTARFDSEIAVYTGSCGSFTCIMDADHYGGTNNTESVQITVTEGTTYYVNIGYYSNNNDAYESGNMDFSAQYFVTNDEAVDAITVNVNDHGAACNNPITVYNAGATSSATINGTPSFNNNGYNGGDVWYKFVAPYTGGVKLTVPEVSDWSSMMHALYTDTNTNVIAKLPNNQNYSINNSSNIPSEVIYTGLVPNRTYYLRIWEFNNDNLGKASFCLEKVVGNDEAGDAIALTVNGYNSQFNLLAYAFNDGATDSSPYNGDPGYSYFNGGDVWFSFVAPDNGEVNVTVVDSEWSSFIHYLYDNPAANTSVAHGTNMNVNNSNNVPDTFTYTGLTPGHIYYMRAFDHGNDDFGWVTFYLSETNTQNVADYESLNFSYYPNPATDFITIKSQEKIENISIFNLEGQQVIEKQAGDNQITLDISDLPLGIYLMKVQTSNRSTTVKIVKK